MCLRSCENDADVFFAEPGYYEDGKFGIRIENVVICVEADPQPPHRFGDKPWLTFTHVTMTPMCRNLIDAARLTRQELEYLNKYHAEVREKTKGFFEKPRKGESTGERQQREIALKWLMQETEPIEGAQAET